MTDAELRAKIRALMASGDLPSEPLAAEPRCLVCAEAGPQIALFYPAGVVVRLHAACEALWRQEREGLAGRT